MVLTDSIRALGRSRSGMAAILGRGVMMLLWRFMNPEARDWRSQSIQLARTSAAWS